jgi:CHASE2 domain-containing sensor protein
VVFSRVFSPQYSIWLLGLGALTLAAPASRVRVPVLLVAGAALLAQILYPWGYGAFLSGHWGFVAVHALRIILVAVAAVWAVLAVSRDPGGEPLADIRSEPGDRVAQQA